MNTFNLNKSSWAARWRWLRRWRQNELVEGVDRAGVLAHVREAGGLGPRYAFMIVMSCGIATLGLLQNSVAVIIGAMLISPLMGPIVELGMGLATFDLRTIRSSLLSLAAGVTAALLISVCIVLASPLQEPTPEILARTQPTLFDLLVAVFSGLAGAYATVTRKGETIVGVAIATALMPPLAVVGYGLALGNAHVAGGAGFLFMTNLLAIALSVTIVARLYGFGSSDSPKQTMWQATLIVGIFLLLSVPLGLALRNIAQSSSVERAVRQVVEAEAAQANGRVSALRVAISPEAVGVDTVLMVPGHVAALPERIAAELQRTLGRKAEVQVREVLLQDEQSLQREALTLAQLRGSVAQLEEAARRKNEEEAGRSRGLDSARDALLARLGRLETLEGGRQRLLLDPAAGLSLAAARRLQPAADAAGAIEVVPAVQAFPSIAFADDSAELDASARANVELAAWAASRWRVAALRVTGFGGDERLARRRAQAVAEALGASANPSANANAITVRSEVADAAALRERVRKLGADAARSATVQVDQGD